MLVAAAERQNSDWDSSSELQFGVGQKAAEHDLVEIAAIAAVGVAAADAVVDVAAIVVAVAAKAPNAVAVAVVVSTAYAASASAAALTAAGSEAAAAEPEPAGSGWPARFVEASKSTARPADSDAAWAAASTAAVGPCSCMARTVQRGGG